MAELHRVQTAACQHEPRDVGEDRGDTLGLEKPEPRRALAGAVTIAAAYIGSGFIPLGPYMAMKTTTALTASVGITLIALVIFGYVKGHFYRCVAGTQLHPNGVRALASAVAARHRPDAL